MPVINAVRWDISKEIVSMMEISPLTTNRLKMDSHLWTDPVVGKCMTNLIATTPITVKAMKNLYAELNRQNDLKRTYCRKYKDLQAMLTTAEHNVLLQHPNVVKNTKAKANPQILKVAPGKNKGAIGKGKGTKPLNKGKGRVVKPTTSTANASASPAANTRAKTKDQLVVTVHMLQELMGELQTIERESLYDDHNSKVTLGSDLEEEDS